MHVRVTPSLMAKAADVKSRALPLLNLLRRLSCFASAHERVIFWGLAVLYRISLDLLYCLSAYPIGGYMILPFTASAFRYMVSCALYLVLYAALPKREEDSIVLAAHLQFAFSVAPMLTLYAFSHGSSRYILAVFLCVLLQTLVIFRPLRTAEPVRIKGVQSYMTIMLGILTVFTLVVPILYNGFAGFRAFDSKYIYVMRANATYPPGFSYLIRWVTLSILPFALLSFLHMKKYRWAALAATMQVVFYMQLGTKVTLLILFPMVFLYFCCKSGHCVKLMYLALSLCGLVIVLLCGLDQIGGAGGGFFSRIGIYAASLIAVRALFIPAGIKFQYYSCFSGQPKLYFSDGQIGRMFGLIYPYKLSSGFVVNAFSGAEFGTSQANTGYLGESYAQMGFAGMLLMSLLLALILRSLRVYDRKESAPLLTALICVYIILLNDGALFSTLLSGGLLVTYGLIFIYFDKVTKGDGHGVQRL